MLISMVSATVPCRRAVTYLGIVKVAFSGKSSNKDAERLDAPAVALGVLEGTLHLFAQHLREG